MNSYRIEKSKEIIHKKWTLHNEMNTIRSNFKQLTTVKYISKYHKSLTVKTPVNYFLQKNPYVLDCLYTPLNVQSSTRPFIKENPWCCKHKNVWEHFSFPLVFLFSVNPFSRLCLINGQYIYIYIIYKSFGQEFLSVLEFL